MRELLFPPPSVWYSAMREGWLCGYALAQYSWCYTKSQEVCSANDSFCNLNTQLHYCFSLISSSLNWRDLTRCGKANRFLPLYQLLFTGNDCWACKESGGGGLELSRKKHFDQLEMSATGKLQWKCCLLARWLLDILWTHTFGVMRNNNEPIYNDRP